MSRDPNRFTESTKRTLAMRAAQKCSNPYCRTPTSAPHSDDGAAVNLGEAAHIHGANRGSARYDEKMTSAARRAPSNGIWLCTSCAGKIDRDEVRFPAQLLFRWKRLHEEEVLQATKLTGDIRELHEIQLMGVKDESLKVQQIVLDRPPLWEYLLTVELLSDRLGRAERRLARIRAGLELVDHKSLSVLEFGPWGQEQLANLSSGTELVTRVLNETLAAAWGAQGAPGDVTAIVDAVDLIGKVAERFVDWEATARHLILPTFLQRLEPLMLDWTTQAMAELRRLRDEMAAPLNEEEMPKEVKISLVFEASPAMERFSEELASLALQINEANLFDGPGM